MFIFSIELSETYYLNVFYLFFFCHGFMVIILQVYGVFRAKQKSAAQQLVLA